MWTGCGARTTSVPAFLNTTRSRRTSVVSGPVEASPDAGPAELRGTSIVSVRSVLTSPTIIASVYSGAGDLDRMLMARHSDLPEVRAFRTNASRPPGRRIPSEHHLGDARCTPIFWTTGCLCDGPLLAEAGRGGGGTSGVGVAVRASVVQVPLWLVNVISADLLRRSSE